MVRRKTTLLLSADVNLRPSRLDITLQRGKFRLLTGVFAVDFSDELLVLDVLVNL